MKNRLIILIASIFCITSCSEKVIENGVSQNLAQERKENISNICYDLFFDIPDKMNREIRGEVNITFNLKNIKPTVLDFKTDMNNVNKAIVNGEYCDLKVENEHIIIDSKYLKESNEVVIYFESPNTSLNRRKDFLYTLLVPDRARTLFPCFDQPNMKAKFSLRIATTPKWRAISNGSIKSVEKIEDDRINVYSFEETEPISTYLFSFVVGDFEKKNYKNEKHDINIYYREKDSDKVAQLDIIADEVFKSLEWLEDYTQIDYPFEKYDLIILPGFQYGGMEHMGATLYNDSRMFTSKKPSLSEQISRSSLIAHETAHMWFGDLVTMDWFNEVWLKEVFANYYAAEIIKNWYSEISEEENFVKYFTSAYQEDRTSGSNSLSQPLDNLENAGLVYGNIIYNKAPIVMQMLVNKIGKENFDNGIRTYLSKYSYSNATWDNLIEILDIYTPHDLISWSNVWVDKSGMPTIESEINQDTLYIVQSDPFKRGVVWQEDISFLAVGEDFRENVELDMNRTSHSIALPKGTKYILPNDNLKGYGFFALSSTNMEHSIEELLKKDNKSSILKHSILNNLHENMLNNYLSPEQYSLKLVKYIEQEEEPLLFAKALSNLNYCYTTIDMNKETSDIIENILWKISGTSSDFWKQTLNTLLKGTKNDNSKKRLLNIFNEVDNIKIEDESMKTSFALYLSLYFPEQSKEILEKQLDSIKNPDKQDEFKFVSQAVNADSVKRNQFFKSLLKKENREVEPWVTKSLTLLNHPTNKINAINYIRPALDILPEIQKTGDIFFPRNWLSALLSGHNSNESKNIVTKFISENEDTLNPMLMNKVKQQAYELLRD